MTTAADPGECPRCGHTVHQAPTARERLRRVVGRAPRRLVCSAPTPIGACACRSRYHVR